MLYADLFYNYENAMRGQAQHTDGDAEWPQRN